MKKEKIELSIVIPCYCASNNIRSVLEEIDKTLKNRKIVYEVILVNDASPDDTYDVISRLTEERTNIVSIDLAKNSGQHAALMAGFQYAKGNIVATFEDDGQSEAELLTVMLDKMEEGYDIVTPHYIKRVQPSLFRRFGSKCERFMEDWLIEKPNGVYVSIYFMARKFVIEELCKYDQPYPYISGLILRSTSHIASVEGGVQKGRIGGNSGYNLKKLFSLWVNGFTAFSIKPLRISIVIGALFAEEISYSFQPTDDKKNIWVWCYAWLEFGNSNYAIYVWNCADCAWDDRRVCWTELYVHQQNASIFNSQGRKK